MISLDLQSDAKSVSDCAAAYVRIAEATQASAGNGVVSTVVNVPTPLPSRGLPNGCTLDDLIRFPEEAAVWMQVSPKWLVRRQHILPGVIIESNKVKRFHPRTYLDKRLKK